MTRNVAHTQNGGDQSLPNPNNNLCFIVYQNLTQGEITSKNISNYSIDYKDYSKKQIENFGSVQREIVIFNSQRYPTFLFMMVLDYYVDSTIRTSLFYRLMTSELYYTDIKQITNPKNVFNNGIDGCVDMETPMNICKFRFGDLVEIVNQPIRFAHNLIESFVTYKVGRISQILPKDMYSQCQYNILFQDGTEGISISESKISSTNNTLSYYSPNSTLGSSNLFFLNNLSQLNKTQGDIQDVNDDKKLQDDVIKFFVRKTIKWINKNPEFAKVKNQSEFVSSHDGKKYIRKILKSYVKKNKTKWYELRNDNNYEDVKDYIREKLLQLQ